MTRSHNQIKTIISRLFYYIKKPFCRADRWKIKNDDLVKYLCSNNVEVIQELYSLTKTLRSEEYDRTKALDTKSASLFGLLSILGSAALLAISTKEDQPFATVINSQPGKTLIILALLSMGVSLFFLFFAVKVRSSHTAPGDADLFGGILEYDGVDVSREYKPDTGYPRDGHKYRRFLTEHFWKLYKAASDKNEAKATLLGWGQNFLFGALLLIVALQVHAVLCIVSMNNDSSGKPTTLGTPKAQSTTSDRPAPLAQSTAGIRVTNSCDRPLTIAKSSSGQSIRLSTPSKNPKGNGK